MRPKLDLNLHTLVAEHSDILRSQSVHTSKSPHIWVTWYTFILQKLKQINKVVDELGLDSFDLRCFCLFVSNDLLGRSSKYKQREFKIATSSITAHKLNK
jgi:hypothetical protein